MMWSIFILLAAGHLSLLDSVKTGLHIPPNIVAIITGVTDA